MGLLGKIKRKELKETVVKGCVKDFDVVITQFKASYKSVSVYKVYTELKYNGELFDIIDFHITCNRKKSDRVFSMLERKYQEETLKRKRF